jgi:hypothetical protein
VAGGEGGTATGAEGGIGGDSAAGVAVTAAGAAGGAAGTGRAGTAGAGSLGAAASAVARSGGGGAASGSGSGIASSIPGDVPGSAAISAGFAPSLRAPRGGEEIVVLAVRLDQPAARRFGAGHRGHGAAAAPVAGEPRGVGARRIDQRRRERRVGARLERLVGVLAVVALRREGFRLAAGGAPQQLPRRQPAEEAARTRTFGVGRRRRLLDLKRGRKRRIERDGRGEARIVAFLIAGTGRVRLALEERHALHHGLERILHGVEGILRAALGDLLRCRLAHGLDRRRDKRRSRFR